ncbi:MAG: TatD family hydrolase [Lentisphaerota bacterium]
MELFDTHFHYDGAIAPEIIANEASAEGVKYLACIGGDYHSSVESMKFAEVIDNSFFTAGVHPHYAQNESWDLNKFKTLLSHPKCVAVGEIGLDFFYENSAKEIQMKVFEDFCKFGVGMNMPLVIHCRDKENNFDAYNLVYQILSNYVSRIPGFVVHCYTGNLDWMVRFLDIGGYIGITGIVTFPKADNVRELIPMIPDDKLLIETDSPYLAPKPFRGKTNYPKYLKYVAQEIARLKGMTIDDLAFRTTDNALRFYRLKKNY